MSQRDIGQLRRRRRATFERAPPPLSECDNATHAKVATPVWSTPTAVTITRPRHTLAFNERGSS